MKKLALLMVAALLPAFIFAQTKTEMKPAELSKPAAEYIAKNFIRYNIDKVFKCDNKDTLTFEVTISKGKQKQVLVFDKDGIFKKKEILKVEKQPAVPPAATTGPSAPPVQEEPKKEKPKKK